MTDEARFDTLPADANRPDPDLPASDLIMGIDLGTTYSCVAIVQDDFPKVIASGKGLRTLPSMVAVDEKGRLLVGEEARRQLLINPTNTIYGAKRFIGRNFYSKEVEVLSKHFSYAVVPIGEMSAGAQIGERTFSLPQVSALILNELRCNVCEYLKENVSQAVISVPAYYSENQREAVRQAGRIADIDVVRIINEPTAAALAYGLNRNFDQKLLVYDLGGGTFDASLLEVYENVFKVISTGGDTFLGGVDFDDRVMDFILDSYEQAEGEILQCDSVITQRLKEASERAKIDLSAKHQTSIDLPYITVSSGKFKDFQMELDREKLVELTEDLVDRTIQVCHEVLEAARAQTGDVASVILVGGQTRMPMVVEKVSDFFGKAPTKGVHPDEVVACGAALMAHSLGTEQSVRLIDVLPMSIGARQPNGKSKILFEANCTLPTDREVGVTTTHDDQLAIEVFLYQGESENAVENEFLGAFVITGFEKAAKGKIKIVAQLKLNQESILEVTAKNYETGEPLHVQMIVRPPVALNDLTTDALPATTNDESAGEIETPQEKTKSKRFKGLRNFIRKISD